jgi:predicted nucleic acid-binding protein
MNFFDTSVLAAAFLASNAFHVESASRIADLSRENAVCSSHTFAELYVTLTRQPPAQRVQPTAAALIVERVAKRVKAISLTPQEYVEIIGTVGSQGLSGAVLYDALLIGCARKADAERIYTLNAGHFRLVARDLAPRVMTP